MNDQGQTLGFSANLEYSNVRCETFWAYFFGKEALFNDRFDGAGDAVLEEVPEGDAVHGFFGRGLVGLWDGVLKAFGL